MHGPNINIKIIDRTIRIGHFAYAMKVREIKLCTHMFEKDLLVHRRRIDRLYKMVWLHKPKDLNKNFRCGLALEPIADMTVSARSD